jgi:diguanylate cyclase (GGDEF)-like protein
LLHPLTMANPLRTLYALAPHVLLLGGASVAALRPVPASLEGLLVYGPWAATAAAATIAAAFGRGRACFAVLAVAAAYAAYRFVIEPDGSLLARRAAFAGVSIALPLYLGVLAALVERGVMNARAALRLVPIAVVAGALAWAVRERRADLIDVLFTPWLSVFPASLAPLPQLAVGAVFLAFAAALAMALLRGHAVEAGIATAIATMAIAAHGLGDATAFPVFTMTACAALAVAVLQDSYRMAFRDELTGLPGRRALNERLKGLGRRYVVAMVDVDHFKRFNDAHGHDVGDDVLRMVAARLARVGGGGRAFRYGGEEFTVLFPGRSLDAALPHIEALRAEIEAHRMALRAPGRPVQDRVGRMKRGTASTARRTVSVTVSIGVADRDERHTDPDAVVAAADKALYRAKRGGRNKVST